jgi:hypothetical protein
MTRAFGCGRLAASVLLVACGRASGPEDVALEYGRAIYASDAEAAWRLISEADRQVQDKPTFRRQQQALHGLTRDAVRQLAGYITATPVKTTITADRATVTLRFRLPDANAPTVRALMPSVGAPRRPPPSSHREQVSDPERYVRRTPWSPRTGGGPKTWT